MMTATAPALHQAARPLAGILLAAAAALAFALADVGMKHLTARYPVPVIAAVRYVVSLGILLVFLGPRLGSGLWRTQRTGLVLARGLVLASASLTMGLALSVLPVGETIAIMYLSPFLVMLLAMPLLGERVGPAAWIAAVVGFSGVLLIVRPGTGLDPFGVVMALVNAGLATAYQLTSRTLARTETMPAMLFNSMLVGTVVFCPLALASPGVTIPPLADLGLMALLGATALTGHALFTAAYREAPASLLAPISYVHLFWAGGLGWLVFGHVPDGWSLLGIVMVGGGGIAIALRAHLDRRAAGRIPVMPPSPAPPAEPER